MPCVVGLVLLSIAPNGEEHEERVKQKTRRTGYQIGIIRRGDGISTLEEKMVEAARRSPSLKHRF